MENRTPLTVSLFDRFVQDRKFMKNVTAKTLGWYQNAWKAFAPYLEPNLTNGASLREGLMDGIGALLAKGVKPVSVNSYLTCIRAFLFWLYEEGIVKERPKVKLLKHEQRLLATFSPTHVRAIIDCKPTGLNRIRIHALACFILDTGVRVDEARTLTPKDVDLENMLVTVMGKGRKERKVPLSMDGRKLLFKFMSRNQRTYVFGTDVKTPCTTRNIQRDFAVLCRALKIEGVRCSPHTLRHTFAANYLRAGGNLYYLSRILGHNDIRTTQIYLKSLGVEDFKKVHDGLSALSNR